MDKGKTKVKNKHLSIVFIPHSSSDVKVFKFSFFYGKIFAAILLFVAIVTGTALYLKHVTNENLQLKQNLNELYSANLEQKKIIEQKSAEIKKIYEDNEEYKKTVEEKLEEFAKKYNEITDKYLANQSLTNASRSGGRTPASFSNEIATLKDMLDNLEKYSNVKHLATEDLATATSKIDAFFETIPTLIPVNGKFNNGFGYRTDPFTKKKAFHEGIDFSANKGTSIKASAGGKVVFAGRNGGYGLCVVIDHGRGLSTRYAHASKLLVKEGQQVKKGDVIAQVGSTGRSTGPHLHFEVLLYNKPVDPELYLDIK